MRKKVTMFLMMGLFLSPVGFLPAELWAAAPYYEGKVLTIICAHAPGGGYDRMSRLLARHLPKYLPGKPSVVVKQMTGGGNVIAANYVYNQAKPDGLTITALDRGIGVKQLMGLDGLAYDFTKYAWIGNVASEPAGLFLTTKLPYKTFNDVLKAKDKKLYFGAAGLGTYVSTFPMLLRDYLGINTEIVFYPDASAAIQLAIERGEVNGAFSTFSTYLPFVNRGVVKPLLRGPAETGIPEFDKLPVIDDLITDRKGKGIVRIYSSGEVVARPYVAPPGTPNEIMKILRDAFANVSKDRELLAEVGKQQMEYGFMTAEESLKIVNGYMSSPPDVIQSLKRYASEK